MKQIRLLSVLFLFLPFCLGSQIIDRIVAVVNGEIICLSELKKWCSFYLRESGRFAPETDMEERMRMIEGKVLDQLINQKLLDQEAKRLKIEVSKKEIDRAIEDVQKRNAFSRQEFLRVLKKEGLTMDIYREQIASEIKKMRLIEYEIGTKVKISDEEIKDYYLKNMAKPEIKEGVRIQQIFFALPPQADEEKIEEVRSFAMEIYEKLKRGEDFGKMAQEFSQDTSSQAGGDLGFFKKGELLPVLEEAAFQLNEGEMSPVIQSQLGFHIIKVLEKREGEVKPDGWIKSKDEIKNILYQKEVNRLFEEWLKKLREKSYIDIKL